MKKENELENNKFEENIIIEKRNKDIKSGKKEEVSRGTAANIYDWVSTFCQALFVVVILFTFFFRFVTVSGNSMTNTLSDKDKLIITDIGYTPKRGDIVVIQDLQAELVEYNGERTKAFPGPIIKRVIATEGEKVIVDYENWTITVIDTNGKKIVLDEPYVRRTYDDGRKIKGPLNVPLASMYPQSVGQMQEHTVKEGHVFVCGDNRSGSLDSRYVGDIDVRKILGKVILRVFPKPEIMKKVSY